MNYNSLQACSSLKFQMCIFTKWISSLCHITNLHLYNRTVTSFGNWCICIQCNQRYMANNFLMPHLLFTPCHYSYSLQSTKLFQLLIVFPAVVLLHRCCNILTNVLYLFQSAAAAPSPVMGNMPPNDGMPGGPMPPGFFQVGKITFS